MGLFPNPPPLLPCLSRFFRSFASKYMLYLPGEEELTKELEREKWLIEMAMENGRLSLT